MKKLLPFLAIVALGAWAFRTPFQSPDNTLTAAEKKAGWHLLFDGKTTNGWRPYQHKDCNSWEVVDGTLHCIRDTTLHHTDLVSDKSYGSFDLQWDWKVAKASNSGLLYHVLETKPHSYETGPEYQMIDDIGWPGGIENWQKSGADYAMHPPAADATKPAGEWNHSELKVQGAHVEHWLNGHKLADFEAWTPEWQKLKTEGKWKDYPDYGNAKTGLLAFQDHDGGVWLKNIKIKL